MAHKIFTTKLDRTVVGKSGEKKQVTREVSTLALSKGQKLYVRGILGSTAESLATITDLADEHFLVVFKEDVLVRAEGLSDNLMTCTNLRFARPNRPYVKQEKKEAVSKERKPRVFHNKVTLFGRLLAACLQSERKPVSVPGGLQYALAYCHDENGVGGEMIIAAPKKDAKIKEGKEGEVCTGFIVPVAEIDGLLASLPSRE